MATGMLQADCCIIMQIASLVNTKNVRTTPPADNQPLLRRLSNRLDHRDLTSPFPIWLSKRQRHYYTCAIDATMVLGDLVAPDASSRRVLSATVYVTLCTESVSCNTTVFSKLSSKLIHHFASILLSAHIGRKKEKNKIPQLFLPIALFIIDRYC